MTATKTKVSKKTTSASVSNKDVMRKAAEDDLYTFIKLVHPSRVLGGVHKELLAWWTRQDRKTHQLTLLPRDHQKSALSAYRVVWAITRNPAIRILYLSSTSNLAQKQLKFIKDILTSASYRYYWPDMVDRKKANRAKWSETEIAVDHPKRKEEFIRDPTIFTAGLTTGIVGMHFDVVVPDDVIVGENAYTAEGRRKVASQMSYLASILGTEGELWAVGTRYNPKDYYDEMSKMQFEVYDEVGNITAMEDLYEVFERQVEDSGVGIGEFLWPRQQRSDGKYFGFDRNILARKRSQYDSMSNFKAQYYNDPSERGGGTAQTSDFQYYNKQDVTYQDGICYYRGNRLNVFAAVDFAYTTGKRSDYTCIAVVGVTADREYYVLELDRFKTNKISDYYEHILRLHVRWDFRKLRAEVTAGQSVIVKDLKDNYIKKYGLTLTIDDFKPTSHMGSKVERIDSTLQPKYANKQIWHYVGGNCDILEEELTTSRPAHDDAKDALASVVDYCVPPGKTGMFSKLNSSYKESLNSASKTRSRFGGVIT